MRVECPTCRALIEPTDLHADPGSGDLRFTCPACGAATGEPPSRPAAEVVPAPERLPQVSLDAADPLQSRWAAVESRYDDPRAHDAFVAACEAQGELPLAAARYRDHERAHPGHPETARRLKLVTLLAQFRTLQRSAGRTKDEPDPVRNAVVFGIILLAVILMLVILAPAFLRLKQGAQAIEQARDPMSQQPPRVRNLAEMKVMHP
jgi:hypothetical protein